MNIKQMAIVNVAKLVGFAVAVGVIVNVGLHYLGIATVGVILATGVLVYMIKFMYDIELSKLESKNALTKLKELE
jgi:Flp pilus assembly protein TadB